MLYPSRNIPANNNSKTQNITGALTICWCIPMNSVRIGLFSIDFVPKTSWHRSIARLACGHIWFGRKRINIPLIYRSTFNRVWRRIRQRELLRVSYKCEICGSSNRLQVHEIWEYVKDQRRQRLRGYRVLCSNCHRVHHSSYLIRKGDVSWLVDYIISVNRMREIQLSRVKVLGDLQRAYRIWIERSNFLWYIDISSERYLHGLHSIADILLNYWIYVYRRNSLINWFERKPNFANFNSTMHCLEHLKLNFFEKLFVRSY